LAPAPALEFDSESVTSVRVHWKGNTPPNKDSKLQLRKSADVKKSKENEEESVTYRLEHDGGKRYRKSKYSRLAIEIVLLINVHIHI
jgi:hypothetical protein